MNLQTIKREMNSGRMTLEAMEWLVEEVEIQRQRKEEAYQMVNRYKQARDHINKAIYTEHQTMNSMVNTIHELGQIKGLIKAGEIVRKAFKEIAEENRGE
jgi:hypothetical protein